jgi:hypothetical protein
MTPSAILQLPFIQVTLPILVAIVGVAISQSRRFDKMCASLDRITANGPHGSQILRRRERELFNGQGFGFARFLRDQTSIPAGTLSSLPNSRTGTTRPVKPCLRWSPPGGNLHGRPSS